MIDLDGPIDTRNEAVPVLEHRDRRRIDLDERTDPVSSEAQNTERPHNATRDWRHRATCRDEDPELFFPIGNTGPALLQIEDAKAVCRRCDVVDQCLQWALESGQDAGVWGGMSEDERRALKRRAARARRRLGA